MAVLCLRLNEIGRIGNYMAAIVAVVIAKPSVVAFKVAEQTVEGMPDIAEEHSAAGIGVVGSVVAVVELPIGRVEDSDRPVVGLASCMAIGRG